MLLRPEATFIDQATKRAERVFPRGMEWRTFTSKLPGKEVFANSVLDPAIGIGGELAIQTFATADWRNWISSMQIGLFEIATRIGIPPLESTSLNQGLSLVYSTLESTASAFEQTDDPGKVAADLAGNVGLQVIAQIVGQSNMITMVATLVYQAARWAVDVGRAVVADNLGKDISWPPLQTEDPATDTWQVTRVFEVFRSRGTGGIVFPDGEVEPASNADYTGLFLPAYKYTQPWQIQDRESGVAAQQGFPATLGESMKFQFDIGDGSSFGFMPGTTTTLRVLQASYRSYSSVRGTPVDRYALRCVGVDKPCWKTTKTHDGKRDCKQCVDPETVWPVKGIGWAYSGAPLNATTVGENVGAFYPSANKLLLNMLDAISWPGPLLYTIDIERIRDQWKRSFELFWEFAGKEWRRYHGTGWRGLISRLATFMTAFEHQGEIRLGGREPYMPLEKIADPRHDAEFKIPFADSIFERIIEPFCRDFAAVQNHYLDTVMVAYIPPGAGALYNANGKLKRTKLGDHFGIARRELLNANKRMLVDLRQVSDPEYRSELARVGVKSSPVNAALHGSPGVSGHEILKPDIKPRRAPLPPKVVRASPFEGQVKLVELAREVDLGRKKPVRRAVPPTPNPNETKTHAAVAVGVTVGAVIITAAALTGLHQLTKKDE
jgi:hypothetical protein